MIMSSYGKMKNVQEGALNESDIMLSQECHVFPVCHIRLLNVK